MGWCIIDVIGMLVMSLSLFKDGKMVLVGGLDSKMWLFDCWDGICLKMYEYLGWKNIELRVQSCFGGKERYVVVGDEFIFEVVGVMGIISQEEGKIWVWDLFIGKLVVMVLVFWGGDVSNKKVIIGRDGKEKVRKNVVSCIVWKEGGFGN